MAASTSFNSHLKALLLDEQISSTSESQDLASLEELFKTVEGLSNEQVVKLLQEEWQSDAARHSSQRSTPNLDWLQLAIPQSVPVDSVIALLATQRSDDDISSDLLDLLGYEAFDIIFEVLSKRASIQNEVNQETSEITNGVNHIALHDTLSNVQTPVDSESESQLPANGHQGSRKNRKHARNEGRPKEMKFALHSGMTIEQLEQMHLQKLEEAANRPLIGENNGYIVEEQVKYPHVYANPSASSATSMFGSKVLLPVGSTKVEHQKYTEITVPTPPRHHSAYTATLLPIKSLPPLLQRSFPYETLNRLQSLVYPTAYETSENMLVCAPTGAGKTDVAVLTVLRAINMYADVRMSDGKMRNTDWKVVYVAPMKALAAEIVVKMQKRFKWCGLAVRELTGDMQLTRQEIADTQMIVTTPEKWDVVTRKTTGEGELASRLRLLIIDEVHLLHEDRGAVLESIVARTLRQVESSQTLIRIVGLSATLPNFVDVADFLRVNPHVGLFFFDSSFRPVPLEQHFIAAKGKPGSTVSRENLDTASFEKALDLVKDGHQVLIFVHARKDTVRTAQMIREKAVDEGELEYFDARDNPKLDMFKRDLQMSRNRELKELVDSGIGIHHAGMLRSDRNLSERLFENNVTKILVCTATLAWGVNLPAYAVIIKGTQLYDSSKGAFMDLSVLDVLQMFGRAGRPQYETHGVSYICTTSDKVDHYITAVNQQVPIESKFVEGLVDSLNAEIALGTVTTIDEGVRWLGYTFLHVRMRKNPMVYGLSAADLFGDPALGNRRRELVANASKILQRNGMVQYDADLETVTTTEQGQIASKYYLRTSSIETFNSIFRPKMTEADLLALLAKSSEFQQVAVRESETDELKRLIEHVIPCQVKGGTDSSDGKANVLLQAYICKAAIDDFALISDMEYVAKNAARIARALVEIAISRKWSQATASLLSICQAIEKRLWPWAHPLEQMSLNRDLLYNINRWAEDMPVEEIALMDAAEFGKIIHQNERLGQVAITAAKQFPRLAINHTLQPLSHDLLRVRLQVGKDFVWSEKLHGRAEYFWIWLSDAEDQEILQMTKVVMRENTTTVPVDFTILVSTIPPKLHVRAMSDSWLASESVIEIELKGLSVPPAPPSHRRLVDLAYQPTNFDSDLLEIVKRRKTILSMLEVQCMHSLFFSDANALVCAPLCDARSQLLSVPIWRLFKRKQSSISLVLCPSVEVAKQTQSFLQTDLNVNHRGTTSTVELAVKHSAIIAMLKGPSSGKHTILVSTPKALIHLTNPKQAGSEATLDLIVANDLDTLSPEYEMVLAYLLSVHKQARFVGYSAPLLDATTLASWLRVEEANNFSFHPSARPTPIISSTSTFSLPHSAGLLKAMIKPAYDAMRSNAGQSICFVPHRGQCYTTLTDLLTHSATDMDKFVAMDEYTLSQYTDRISDPKIAEGLSHGFAVLSEGAHPTDQAIAKHLFQTGAVRVLLVPREACHSLHLTAPLVIVMSTQYAMFQPATGERTILDYPMSDILQMQTMACGTEQSQTGQFSIFTQPDNASLISRFINDGLPLESTLLGSDLFLQTVLESMLAGAMTTRQHLLDLLATTFAGYRADVNPAYYSCEGISHQDRLSYLVDELVETWRQALLVRTKESAGIRITAFGSAVLSSRIGMAQVNKLFALSESRASKIASSIKMPEVSQDLLETYLNRLSKTLQKRIRPDQVDEHLPLHKALLVPLLAKKLAPEGSEVEQVQADLAVKVMQALAQVDAEQAASRRPK